MNIACTRLNDGLFELTGRDAGKFLQGYVTCDVTELGHDNWLPGAFCNLQGRVITNFRMIDHNGCLLLKMRHDLVPVIREFLKKYIVFSKAQTRDASDDWIQLGIAGASAPELIDQLFGPPQQPHRLARLTADSAVLSIPGVRPRYEVWLKQSSRAQTLASIDAASSPLTTTDWELFEIESGWSWIEPATANEYLPQMLNLQAQGAVSFTKGCYLGQEIVARTQYRGQLKKHMYRFAAAAPVALNAGIVTPTGDKVGEVIAAVNLKETAQLLAVIRGSGEAELQLESGQALQPLPLPYAIIGEG